MEPTNELPWIIFELKQQLYAISTARVTGISQLPDITRVPNAPPVFLGVTRTRGKVVPTLDLKKLLNIGDGTAELNKAKALLSKKMEGADVYVKELARCIKEEDEFSVSNTDEILGGSFSKEFKGDVTEISSIISDVEKYEAEMVSKAVSAKSDHDKLRDAERSGKQYIRTLHTALEKLNDGSFRMVIFLSDVPGTVDACLCFVVDSVRAVDQLELIEEKTKSKILFMSGYVCGVAHNEKIDGEILVVDDEEVVKMTHVYNQSVEKNRK